MVFYLCSVMILDISVPTYWQELTQSQLRYVYFLMSQNYTSDEVKTFCFCRFGGLKVLQRTDNGSAFKQQKKKAKAGCKTHRKYGTLRGYILAEVMKSN